MKQDKRRGDAAKRDTITVSEIAKILLVSEGIVYKLSASGELPTFRVGKHIRCSRKALDAWIAEQAAK